MEQMHSWLPPSTTMFFLNSFSTPSMSPSCVNFPEQDINQEQQFHICHQKVAFSLRTAAAASGPSCNKQIMSCHLLLTHHHQCKTTFNSTIFFLLHNKCVSRGTQERDYQDRFEFHFGQSGSCWSLVIIFPISSILPL